MASKACNGNNNNNNENLHIVLCPFPASGHLIPMFDIAKLLARRGATVTLVTTPRNASRFERLIARAHQDSGNGLTRLSLARLDFDSDLMTQGCESVDSAPSPVIAGKLLEALPKLRKSLEALLVELVPRPSCLVGDTCLPWTLEAARNVDIPRVSFYGFCCFTLLCNHNIRTTKVYEKYSNSEYFLVPGLPGDKVETTVAQLSNLAVNESRFFVEIAEADSASYGVIVNSFEELEPQYAREYKKARNERVWFVGPVSLCNKEHLDKAQRGNKSNVDENECLNWLDSMKPKSVVYVCLGSLCNLKAQQLIELGLGLEDSNKPFIWVIRANGYINLEELEKWILEQGFEERVKGRGLVIRGWAPQVLILSHPSIGGFLTHCGWNSTLEGISAGVPLITWPLFEDQFLNEKLASQVLKIAVTLRVDKPKIFSEEEKSSVEVKKEAIANAIERVMDEGDQESEERRERARKLGDMAKRAVEEGGSSYKNITLFLEDILKLGTKNQDDENN